MTRVLILTNAENINRQLQVILDEAGFTVFSTFLKPQTIEKNLLWAPDVIILDLAMSDLNGWETCHVIHRVSSVPILILSVVYTPEFVARALDSGADDYLVKPVNINILVARIKTLARRAHPDMAMNGVQYGGVS